MPSATVEDYIKAIYFQQRESAAGEATVVRLSAALGVTKGTVTSMIHKLRDAELATAERYGGIRLTTKGTRLALDVIRRHRLIEVFLVNVLRFNWSEVHEEAERLEHAMSRKLLDRLDAFLGHPEMDPHGDPIPDARGRIAAPAEMPLRTLAKGERGVVSRVRDDESAFLEFAARHGLTPGAHVIVVDVVPEAESLRVRPRAGREVAMSFGAADKILLRREVPQRRGTSSTLPR
ncbi:MAG: metal-dependent transcriptional regulator [Planctomycetota bacterium]|nr:metal-dependent transcriptional regulator [Planctomycetota bacterium]